MSDFTAKPDSSCCTYFCTGPLSLGPVLDRSCVSYGLLMCRAMENHKDMASRRIWRLEGYGVSIGPVFSVKLQMAKQIVGQEWPMRLLIAGWQGQVARALAEAAPACPDVAACAIGRPALDICEMKTITRALADVRPDVVINTAAYTAVDKAESQADEAFALNRDGARMLAQAAQKRGAAVIHLSTDYVFDGSKAAPYGEDDPPAPQTVYSRSKLEGEEMVRAANPRHVIMRTAWVYSPVGSNFVKTMLRLAESRDRLGVVDDQCGNPTYAPHLAEAILGVARQIAGAGPDAPWGTYHAVGSGSATWCGLAREIFRQSSARGGPGAEIDAITTADYPTPARRPANSRLDCDKLQQHFGLRLPDWRDGVKDCVSRLCPTPTD